MISDQELGMKQFEPFATEWVRGFDLWRMAARDFERALLRYGTGDFGLQRPMADVRVA